jgi:hypothetical protein
MHTFKIIPIANAKKHLCNLVQAVQNNLAMKGLKFYTQLQKKCLFHRGHE